MSAVSAVTVEPPLRERTLRLRDGRALHLSEWGPEGGRPVLFCTGAATSGSLGFASSALLERWGLRLVGIDRPGLGGSDAHAEKTLQSFPEDVGPLLGSPDAVAVGFSQGAPFALSLAAAGHVRAVAVVSGQDELSHPLVRPRLHPDVAGMVDAVLRDPAGFERHFSGMATREGLWDLIVSTSAPCDRALYVSEPFRTAFLRALDEGFVHGAHAYARDLVNAISLWPFALEAVSVPVDLWYGARDTSPVHSPAFGVTLASRLPTARRFLLEEEGGALLWTRAEQILSALLEHRA